MKKQGRWFWRPRFTLAAMLVLITVAAIPLAYVAQRRAWNLKRKAAYEALSEKHVLREVRSKAGEPSSPLLRAWRRLLLDELTPQVDGFDYRNIIHWRNYQVALSDADLKLLACFPELESIHLLNADQITDAGLEVVEELPRLRSVDVAHCPKIEGSFLRRVRHRDSLEMLWLVGLPALDGKELRAIASFDSLQALFLGECPRVADDSLHNVELPPKVKSLGLWKCPLGDPTCSRWLANRQFEMLHLDVPITRKSIASLDDQRHLSSLTIENVLLTDDDFQFLKDCAELNSLQLEGMPIRGDLLKWIGANEKLKHLSLSSTLLEDRNLPRLRRFSNLRNLDLSWTPITGEGLEELSQLEAAYDLKLVGARFSEKGMHALADLDCAGGIGIIYLPRNWRASDFRLFAEGEPVCQVGVSAATMMELADAPWREKSRQEGVIVFHVPASRLCQPPEWLDEAPAFDRCPPELMSPVRRLREIALTQLEEEKRLVKVLKERGEYNVVEPSWLWK